MTRWLRSSPRAVHRQRVIAAIGYLGPRFPFEFRTCLSFALGFCRDDTGNGWAGGPPFAMFERWGPRISISWNCGCLTIYESRLVGRVAHPFLFEFRTYHKLAFAQSFVGDE